MKQERSPGIGVDVGGTSTRVVAYDAEGSVEAASTTRTPHGATALIDHLAAEIERVASVTGRSPECIGVGVPGTVRDGVVSMALNVGIDVPVALADRLADRLGTAVRVENDVNAAALGAAEHLATVSDLVLVSIGTGIAAGTVIDGRVVRGVSGSAGEIGHVVLPGRSEVCRCGRHGCLEAIASGRSIVGRMTAAGIAGGAVELWDAAEAGHVAAREIRDDVATAIAWAVSGVCLLLDVEQIVLAGGVASALGERLAASITVAMRAEAAESAWLASARLADRVVAAPVGVELGTLGAVRAARSSLDQEDA